MNKYYYTFGIKSAYPYHNGWVEVHASSWEEAHEKFRRKFPDLPGHEGRLNCSFFYNEEQWNWMDPEHTFPHRCGVCHEIIE